MRSRIFFFFIIIIFLAQQGRSQKISKPDSIPFNKKHLHEVIITESAIFAGTLYLLNNLWYKDYPRSSFHFFNDNNEWLQMDKCGHATTSCTIGSWGYEALKSCGVDNTKAIWYGGGLGSVYMLTIEILDGFSKEWGFSPGDFTANTFGSAVFISQQLAWNQQRIKFKWSYHQTIYPKYRSNELGNGITQTWLKDYNGQTYWLSGNIASFLHKDSKFPKWLNIAIGYGAEGMIGASSNPETYNGVVMPHFTRYRQFYIAPDIDFTKIKTKSKFLKGLLYMLNFLKFPAPAIEYSKENNFRFKALYF
jgi:hypothetical protein